MSLFGKLSQSLRKAPSLTSLMRGYGTRLESKPWQQKPNRKARLSVILTQDVDNLGVKGQIVKVKHGYGRNYLIPDKMAVYATHYNIEDFNAFTIEKDNASVNETEQVLQFLQDKALTIKVPPETFTVTAHHVSRALRRDLQLHVPVDCIEMPSSPLTSGECVSVRVCEETIVELPVNIDTTLTKKQQRKRDKRQTLLARLAKIKAETESE